MSNIKVELNRAGVRALLRSAEVGAACEQHAARMTRAAGVPYVADVYVGPNRVNAGAHKKGDKK